MNDYTLDKPLWVPRSVDETVDLYRDWAVDYDADVLGAGYLTPQRIAAALQPNVDPSTAILDFGCGTGLSGLALKEAGFQNVDGTDITQEMLDLAQEKKVYRRTWQSTATAMSFETGAYGVIVAAGVISLGAAPPETLAELLSTLDSGGILAFSYNDPTLNDMNYINALNDVLDQKHAEQLFRQHGPHLPEKGMGSDVIVLRKL